MRSRDDVERVRRLVDAGHNDCAIAQRTGIPRTTVRAWRVACHGDKPLPSDACPRCGDAEALPRGAYAYLLGLYLGDGHIVAMRRVWRLSVYLDERYPGIIEAARDAIAAVVPGNAVATYQRIGCVAVSAYWKHWPCVFPQHGPGRKHERAIVLQPWQRHLVAAHPRELLRGLVHSDGWRGTNRVTVRGRRYAYPRYNFDNRSDDVRAIFCDACDALGVEWRRMSATTISVARRASVGQLDEFVGPKR